MSKVISEFGIRQVLGLVVAMVLMLGWATAAHAQTPKDFQYGDPTASGIAAIEDSGISGGGFGGTGGGSSGTAAIEDSGVLGGGSAGDPSDPSEEYVGGTLGLLPETGGPSLALVGICAVVLGSAGMLVLRLNGSRR